MVRKRYKIYQTASSKNPLTLLYTGMSSDLFEQVLRIVFCIFNFKRQKDS
jgi:hypothetical protein